MDDIAKLYQEMSFIKQSLARIDALLLKFATDNCKDNGNAQQNRTRLRLCLAHRTFGIAANISECPGTNFCSFSRLGPPATQKESLASIYLATPGAKQ